MTGKPTTFTHAYNAQPLTSGSTIDMVFTPTVGVYTLSVVENFTLNIDGGSAIGFYNFVFTMAGIGGYVMTLQASKFQYKTSTPTLTTTVGRVDVMSGFFDGTKFVILDYLADVTTTI